MHGIPTLITDLTIISIYAGLTTLLFKWLKQPLVLGYVIAGIFAGPFFKFLPSVTDNENIKIWADIGVIFLLFGLGLEFSFKKMLNVGKSGLITASCNILFLLFVGYSVGLLLGWSPMDSLFLGGMISMSSTTIIIKAFEDLNLKRQKFTDLVFGVLVVEDIVGILLLVLLPTIALSQNVNGIELAYSALKLTFFLVLWFLTGIYIVPSLMKKIAPLLNSEMLLVVCIGLCLGMVLLATSAGFSSALGAFIMGSILAETNMVKKIEEVMKPVKDFFGAVFFVSVGMMVNPEMFVTYFWPIVILTGVVISGKVIFSILGFVVSGQPLNTSIQGAFSLAQVGEFAFIIAALGMSIGVLDSYVYPIIVAVSVITTFTTPMMIKSAPKFYNLVIRILPKKWLDSLETITSTQKETKQEKNNWKQLFKHYFLQIGIQSVLLIAIINISFYFIRPYVQDLFPGRWGRVLLTAGTMLVMAPFLKALLVSKPAVLKLYFDLWWADKYNRISLILLTSFRLILVSFFVMLVVHQLLSTNPWITALLVAGGIILVSRSKWLFNQYVKLETQFLLNLNSEAEPEKKSRSADALDTASHLNLTHFKLAEDSYFVDKTLMDLKLRDKYYITIIKVLRGKKVINIPTGTAKLQGLDILFVLGTKSDLAAFAKAVKKKGVEEIIPEPVENFNSDKEPVFDFESKK